MKKHNEPLLLEGEVWKDIPGYEGKYMASNIGRIKALDRTIYRNGHPILFKEYIIKGNYDKRGYLITTLSKEGVEIEYKIHRLVAFAFLPNPKNLPQINHIDGRRDNNRISNLEWCDNAHNVKHSYRQLGRKKYLGERHNKTTLTEDQVLEIRQKYNSGSFRQQDLAEMYHVDRTTISGITRKVRWKHI